MTVNRSVTYKDYFNFLVYGTTDHWSSIYSEPPGENLIQPPADFNLELMIQKVTTDDLGKRVVIREDQKCVVDQLFILETPGITSCLRVGNIVGQAMKNIALGSALLGAALVVSRFTMSKIPYVRMIAFVSSLAMTGCAFLRYLQASCYLKIKEEELRQVRVGAATYREEYYSLETSKEKLNFLYSFETEILFKEALFKYNFSKWGNDQLAQQPKTPEEKKKWVENRLVELNLFLEKGKQLLINGSVKSSTFDQLLTPIFVKVIEFKVLFAKREAAYKSHQIFLLKEKDNVIRFLSKLLGRIVDAYERVKNIKTDITEAEQRGKRLEEYLWLACEAATEGTCLEEAIKSVSIGRMSFCLDSFYYDKARLFLQTVLSIVEKGKGEIPEVKDPFKIPKSQGDLQSLSIPLDDAFYERAKKLVPAYGTQEEYEKFLEEIRTPTPFKRHKQ